MHAGALLEVLTRAGWVFGRYEWSFRTDRRPYVVTNAETGEAIVLNDDTVLRWPQ